MPYYNFQKDLPIAKKTEEEVADILEKVYGMEVLSFENTNKYDILARYKGQIISIEVKEDFTCEKTGNIGLEFSCRGKPSGINTTEASFYIYKIHSPDGKVLFCVHKTDILKNMIFEKKYFRIVNGGDMGSNSMNYLFKLDEFLKTGHVIPEKKIRVALEGNTGA